MGQKIGKASIEPQAKPFINLPRKNMFDLWESFNLVAEGFGLSLSEVQDMFRISLKDYFSYTEKRLSSLAETLFHLFDDDHNGLVDSFEFLSALALSSTMSYEHKIKFIFGIYDFEESGLLNIDAVTLALHASISGLTKMTRTVHPQQEEIDELVAVAFRRVEEGAEKNTSNDYDEHEEEEARIDKNTFIQYVMNTPEIISWMTHFTNLDEDAVTVSKSEIKFHTAPEVREICNGAIYPEIELDPQEVDNTKESGDIQNPWKQMIHLSEPEDIIRSKCSRIPSCNILLEWIHGRNTRVLGNSVFYCSDSGILYPAGSNGVRLTRKEKSNSQEYFTGHKNYISCMTVFQNKESKTIVATGEIGFRPFIHIWDGEKQESLKCIRTIFSVSV